MQITLSRSLLDAVAADCVARFPAEACGILIGSDVGGHRHITAVRAAANVWDSDDQRHRRYLIDPNAQLAAERDAAALGVEVVGFYHSHPDAPPVPSERDRTAAWPFYSYLIVGVGPKGVTEFKSWQFDDAQAAFSEQPVSVTDREAG